MRWKPPQGVKLESEATEGTVTTAKFTGGVEVRAVEGAAPSTEGDLDALRVKVMEGSKITSPGEVVMGRSGSIPNGPTVRWEMRSGSDRSLLYYVPGNNRYVVITLTAPSAGFDRKSDKFELALASLKVN